MFFLELAPLTSDLVASAVELDQLCLGGLWTADGYQREIESPNGVLIALKPGPTEIAAPQPLLGMACLWTILDEAHITLLAVHPTYRREGMGQLLLTSLMQAAWQRKMEWVTLEVRPSNETAIALYRKFGFADVGRRKQYYQNPPEDALILWRKDIQKPAFQSTLQNCWQHSRDRLIQRGWNVQVSNEDLNSPELPLDIGIFS